MSETVVVVIIMVFFLCDKISLTFIWDLSFFCHKPSSKSIPVSQDVISTCTFSYWLWWRYAFVICGRTEWSSWWLTLDDCINWEMMDQWVFEWKDVPNAKILRICVKIRTKSCCLQDVDAPQRELILNELLKKTWLNVLPSFLSK